MRISRAAIALGAVAGLLTGILVGAPAAAAEHVSMLMDFLWQSSQGGFTLAADRGYYAAEGLEVSIDHGQGSGDTISKVASGTYDIGFADINLLVKFNAENPNNKVKAFFVAYDASLASIVTLARTGIKAPKDLEGRTIAAPDYDNVRMLFPTFARLAGIDAAKVKWLSVQGQLRDTMLAQGHADASASFSTTAYLALTSFGIPPADIVTMRYVDYGLDLYGSALVASERTIAERPKLLAGVARAVVHGLKDALARPEDAVASIRQRDPLLKDDVELQRFNMVAKQSMVTPSVRRLGLGAADPERLARTIGFVAEAFKIANPPRPDDVYTGAFLPPREARLVN
ncbi:MAG TPA: ABC transporter substrate-binding protein [Candidatus Sulfotelmatobacter sp.]|nr:ABC transporter substrate-binding protein [Candidatus Sulfotelmatobacter sp.]